MKNLIRFLLLCISFGMPAQSVLESERISPFRSFVEIQPTFTSSNVPFWMRSRQFGSVPISGLSTSFIGGIKRQYDTKRSRKLLDYGFAFEGRANVGKQTEFILPECYAKGRLSIFELKAGRAKEFVGLVDSSLSSGAFAVSGNALGVPKIQLSIPEYYTLPFLGKLFAFKGAFSHGWLGEVYVAFKNHGNINTYFHQKNLYGRFGKPNWRLKLYAGFNHQVFFGNERELYGANWTMSDWETYQHVVLGKTFGSNAIEGSKVGNGLGSLDIGLQYSFGSIQLAAYRQFFYDIGALGHLANLEDGLYGLSFINKKSSSSSSFGWNRFVLEFFYSVNQAGYPWSKRTPSGDEDYYNNYLYRRGWSYQGVGLGNPFISMRSEVRANHANTLSSFFVNNRVMAFYLGSSFSVLKLNCTMKVSYSRNYGTFGTSVYGSSLGNEFSPPLYGIFQEVGQFAGYLDINREIKNGYSIGAVTALDIGDLYYNSSGIIIKASKIF